MDFDQLKEKITLANLEELGGLEELMDTYRCQLAGGIREALEASLETAMRDALSSNLGPLLETFHHVLFDDPFVDKTPDPVFGAMLEEAQLNARIAMSLELGAKDLIRDVLSRAIRSTVDEYAKIDIRSFYGSPLVAESQEA